MRGNSAINNLQNAIGFNYTLNCRVENVRMEQFDSSFVAVGNSTGTTVTGCRFMMHQPRASLNYGVNFADAASDGVVSNNHYEQVRHAFTTGSNPSGSHGVTRRIVFANNTIIRSAQAIEGAGGDAIDTHNGAEDISIIGNTVLGSTSPAGRARPRRSRCSPRSIRRHLCVLRAAGFLFFAFAGYARIATLGEEVPRPGHDHPQGDSSRPGRGAGGLRLRWRHASRHGPRRRSRSQ